MADTRPGLQELIDLFNEASKQKENWSELGKLAAQGKQWYGSLFTDRVRFVEDTFKKRKRLMAPKRPKGVPAYAHQKYIDEANTKAFRALEEMFPSGVYIKGSKEDEAKLARIRQENPILVPLVEGQVEPTASPPISTGRLTHLRDDYVFRKFSELNNNVPKGVVQDLKGEDRKSAYRYALSWLVHKKEPSVIQDLGVINEMVGLFGTVSISHVGEKWMSYFDDLEAVTHWALNDPQSFFGAQRKEALRKNAVRTALMEAPKEPEGAKIHFGQYLGKPLSDLPLTYLLWVQDLVPAAQTFMRAMSGDKPDEAVVPEEAKNPYYVGKRGDSLEQSVGRRVQDLDEKSRARVVRFMETAANEIFAARLKRFVETPEFREAEAKYITFLSEREESGADVAGNRRLREGSVKYWSKQSRTEVADVGQMRSVFHSHGDIVGASYVGLSRTVKQQKFLFAEPAPGLSVRAAKAAQLPFMEEAERRRTLGLKGRFRSPLAVTSELLMEAPAEFREITSQTDPEKARIAIWDQMLRWEEQIETANRPEQLLEIRKSIRVFEYMLKGIGQHFYMDELRRSWQEKMNAIQGRMSYHGKTMIFPRGGKSSKEARSELRSVLGHRPGNASK